MEGSDCDRSVDVAIIGAGPSGSYFAYRLRDAGLNIELFEYSDRIGGRLFTATLPNIPDVNLELGGMRYVEDEHVRVQRLVHELNLTPMEFSQGLGRNERTKYYLRGKILTVDDVTHGEVPYDLSSEEKANQGNLAAYYLDKLTDFRGGLTDYQPLQIKTKDGRDLYTLTMDEAMDIIATPDGRQFLKDVTLYDSAFKNNISGAECFLDQIKKFPPGKRILTVKEGMSSIPKLLIDAFLKSSNSHKLTTNRKLEAISDRDGGYYKLHLRKTITADGLTIEEGSNEFMYAKKVILAIPQFALTQLNWKPLRFPKVKDALNAAIPVKANKVFLTFPTAWWLNEAESSTPSIKSDASFRQMCDWTSSDVSGDYIMLASYANDDFTKHQQNLNSEGELAPGSAVGASKVTNRLIEELLHHLGQVFRIDASLIPEPTGAIAQFWTSYPFGGGWTKWRAGCTSADVVQIIQRPSPMDDVYIVGADHAGIGKTPWAESALTTVDLVYDKYFKCVQSHL